MLGEAVDAGNVQRTVTGPTAASRAGWRRRGSSCSRASALQPARCGRSPIAAGRRPRYRWKSSPRPSGSALRLREKADSMEALSAWVEVGATPALADGECLVEVRASGVNTSDVKAALGHMPHAVWPRVPGSRLRGCRRRRAGRVDRQGGLGQQRGAGHPPRRCPCEICRGSCRRDQREALQHLGRGSRCDRRSPHHGLGETPGGRGREAARPRSGARRERQGRPGRNPDRHHERGPRPASGSGWPG